LAVAVTAVVVLAWYAAMKRLGVDRTGLFNGLIPITALAAIALTGTGTITPLQVLAALTVLAGVLLGLGRSPARTGTAGSRGVVNGFTRCRGGHRLDACGSLSAGTEAGSGRVLCQVAQGAPVVTGCQAGVKELPSRRSRSS